VPPLFWSLLALGAESADPNLLGTQASENLTFPFQEPNLLETLSGHSAVSNQTLQLTSRCSGAYKCHLTSRPSKLALQLIRDPKYDLATRCTIQQQRLISSQPDHSLHQLATHYRLKGNHAQLRDLNQQTKRVMTSPAISVYQSPRVPEVHGNLSSGC
jgi:hypothetical protein